MQTIWKFPFELTDKFTIDMPKGAKVLTVQVQNEHPCIWALVNDKAPVEKRTFSLVGTGTSANHITAHWRHVGSCQLQDGALVIHLFEESKAN